MFSGAFVAITIFFRKSPPRRARTSSRMKKHPYTEPRYNLHNLGLKLLFCSLFLYFIYEEEEKKSLHFPQCKTYSLEFVALLSPAYRISRAFSTLPKAKKERVAARAKQIIAEHDFHCGAGTGVSSRCRKDGEILHQI